MSGQWHGGKGSAPRKQQDKKAYDDGYERIFGNKSKRDSSEPQGDSDKTGSEESTGTKRTDS